MRPGGGAGSRATCSCVLLPDWRNDALAPRADTTPACVCTELPPETIANATAAAAAAARAEIPHRGPITASPLRRLSRFDGALPVRASTRTAPITRFLSPGGG